MHTVVKVRRFRKLVKKNCRLGPGGRFTKEASFLVIPKTALEVCGSLPFGGYQQSWVCVLATAWPTSLALITVRKDLQIMAQ